KMAENGVDALSIMQMIQANNGSMQSGSFVQHDQEFLLTTGQFLASKEDMENLVVGVHQQMPVYLKQVAQINDAAGTAKSYVSFGYSKNNENFESNPSECPAVTLSIAKVQGADAMQISEQILKRVEKLQDNLIPKDVKVEVTRNYRSEERRVGKECRSGCEQSH